MRSPLLASLTLAVSLVLSLAFSLVLSLPASAQDRPPLTLRAALAEALSRNAELIALRQEYEAARAAPLQERFLMPPSFETQIWGWPITTLNPARTDMFMFTGEQEIPGRGKRAARALVSEREAEVSHQRVLVRTNELLNDITQAYLEVGLARETLTIYDHQLPMLHDMADAATQRYAAGQAGQRDTVVAIGEMTRLHDAQITSRERGRLAEARLNALLGREPGATVESLSRHRGATPPGTAELERVALQRHPQMAMAAAEVARESAELARLRGDRRPDFVVGGGYMLQPGGAGAWTARAGMTWPNAPWSRRRLDAAIDAQAKRVAAATARRDSTAAGIRRLVEETVIHFDAARERVALLQTTVLPHAEHEFGLARVSYTASRGTFGDVIDSQRMLLSAEVDRAAALADLERALADVESATGGPPDDESSPVPPSAEETRR